MKWKSLLPVVLVIVIGSVPAAQTSSGASKGSLQITGVDLGKSVIERWVALAESLHLVVESQLPQTTTVEYWITDDKTYERRGARVTISRQDLGVRWVINTQKGTYSETRLTSPARNEARVEDVHTAGFSVSYEPEFVWTVTDSAEVKTINERPCRLTVATGIDDFAEMTLKLWLCHTDRPALDRKANGPVLDSAQFRYQNPVTFATDLLSKRPHVVLMDLEATVEPPTLPTKAYRVVVRTIENIVPPAGIFDLPAGIQKTPQP